MLYCCLLIFSKSTFLKYSFRNTTRVLNNLDLDQDQHILHAFLSSAIFSTFFKNSYRNTIRVSISLNPDQGRHSVGPDLGPNSSR